MAFDADTYVCLDIPEPVAQAVMEIRSRHRDAFRSALPAEITVAGSSGVGVFESAQNEAAAFALLEKIAAETAPIEASFKKVVRFPGTDIFAAIPVNPQPFRALHERITTSGIRFQASPFPFTPHCTLRSRSPVSEEEAAELLSLEIPGIFVLDTLSVYMQDQLPLTLLYRTKLTGKPGHPS